VSFFDPVAQRGLIQVQQGASLRRVSASRNCSEMSMVGRARSCRVPPRSDPRRHPSASQGRRRRACAPAVWRGAAATASGEAKSSKTPTAPVQPLSPKGR